ncbi:MAG: tyrosine-type recombinase/integrase [Hydrogenophaga sp.]|nr:tyrosine-type recombinase/integrase [Hydrogenophaga sp.]
MAFGDMTDSEAIDAFCDWLHMAQGRSLRTLEVYRLALTRLGEFMRPRSIREADGSELEAFTGLWLHKKGVVAQSRKPYVSAVRVFFGWAKMKGLLPADRNPAAEIAHPKTGRNIPRAMSLASAERLMWAPDLGTFVGIRDAAMMALLMGCGLRVGGLCALNEGDLQTVVVGREARMVVRVIEKGAKERLVPVPREADALLRVYLAHEDLALIDRNTTNRRGKPDKVLFVNTKHPVLDEHEHIGEARRLHRRGVWGVIQRHGERVGIPPEELHPHAMRHLFGTELTEEDVSLATTQELMGHADPKSTKIYITLSMRKKMRSVDQAAPLAKMRTPISEFLKRVPR